MRDFLLDFSTGVAPFTPDWRVCLSCCYSGPRSLAMERKPASKEEIFQNSYLNKSPDASSELG